MTKEKQVRRNPKHSARGSQSQKPSTKSGSRLIRVSFPAPMVAAMDAIAAALGKSRDQFIISALEEGLALIEGAARAGEQPAARPLLEPDGEGGTRLTAYGRALADKRSAADRHHHELDLAVTDAFALMRLLQYRVCDLLNATHCEGDGKEAAGICALVSRTEAALEKASSAAWSEHVGALEVLIPVGGAAAAGPAVSAGECPDRLRIVKGALRTALEQVEAVSAGTKGGAL